MRASLGVLHSMTKRMVERYKCIINSQCTRSLDNANRLYEFRTDGDIGKIVSSFVN
jgi:hypothetical protein